jgi:hypothetical protein
VNVCSDNTTFTASYFSRLLRHEIQSPERVVDSSWNVMAHGDAREGKWRGNWQMEWVASNLHTTSENGVSSITTADGHNSAASSRLNWRPHGFKWTRPFRRKTKSGFCACAITFELASSPNSHVSVSCRYWYTKAMYKLLLCYKCPELGVVSPWLPHKALTVCST